jgi:hypothetical protein
MAGACTVCVGGVLVLLGDVRGGGTMHTDSSSSGLHAARSASERHLRLACASLLWLLGPMALMLWLNG